MHNYKNYKNTHYLLPLTVILTVLSQTGKQKQFINQIANKLHNNGVCNLNDTFNA